LASKSEVPEPLSGPSCIEELKSGRYPLLIDSIVRVEGLQSNIDALEWISLGTKRKQGYYIPIRTSPREILTREDKCLLAFDAIVLSQAVDKVPAYGKIIHGRDFRVVKVKLPGLLKTARSIVEDIAKQQSSNDAPPPVLNRHCVQCGFRARCRKAAEERDDLSLLANMSKAERATLHKKGIFSVHQLSYTFRVRRKPKHLLSNHDRYSNALKALAIREQQIHVVGAPQLPQAETRMFLDVEGVPDRDLQYLIGLRIRDGESCTHGPRRFGAGSRRRLRPRRRLKTMSGVQRITANVDGSETMSSYSMTR
jgi:predicted RecB family nuclease